MNHFGLETLFLDKFPGKENICVKPIYQMYDHQVDGVRFIFKKWKTWKNKSQMKPSDYCVLNFPPKQGKSTTVSLFLYAVHRHLNFPILVLCKDDEEVHIWMSHLKKWTGFREDDIAVDPNKALINKQVFLKKYSDMSKLGPFCSRSWSVVVIKSNIFVPFPHFCHAEFTIWITSAVITNNMSLLKSMHNWILPKIDFKMHTEILPSWKNEILKHSMIESFVLIRKPNSLMCQEKESFESSERKRLKNKDASGLKVKRSRKNAQNNCQDEIPEKFDVETFIRNEKPVRSKDMNEEFYIDIDIEGHVKNNIECDTNEEIRGRVQILDTEKPEVQFEHTHAIIEDSKSTEYNIVGDKGDLEPTTDNSDKETINIAKIGNKGTDEVVDGKENAQFETEHNSEIIKEGSSGITESNIKTDKETADLQRTIESDVARTKSSLNYDSDLDSKLKEMQERTMRKFKGSLLDSIF